MTEGREATAEQEGRDAYQTGVPQHQNPYVATFAQSEARLAWLTGWLAAEGRESTPGDEPPITARDVNEAAASGMAERFGAGRKTTGLTGTDEPSPTTTSSVSGREATAVVDIETLRLLVSLARGYTQSRGQFIDRDGVLLAAEAALQRAEDEEARRG